MVLSRETWYGNAVASRASRLLTGLGLVLAVALVALPAWAFARPRPPAPLYTVEQVVNGAMQHPRAWDSRLVRVQAIASLSQVAGFQGGVQRTHDTTQILLSSVPDPRAGAMGQDGMIYLLSGHEDHMVALLRRVPFIGAAVPPPQRVSLTHAATYLLQVHLAAHGCNFSPCVAAILVGAAPSADPAAYTLPDM